MTKRSADKLADFECVRIDDANRVRPTARSDRFAATRKCNLKHCTAREFTSSLNRSVDSVQSNDLWIARNRNDCTSIVRNRNHARSTENLLRTPTLCDTALHNIDRVHHDRSIGKQRRRMARTTRDAHMERTSVERDTRRRRGRILRKEHDRAEVRDNRRTIGVGAPRPTTADFSPSSTIAIKLHQLARTKRSKHAATIGRNRHVGKVLVREVAEFCAQIVDFIWLGLLRIDDHHETTRHAARNFARFASDGDVQNLAVDRRIQLVSRDRCHEMACFPSTIFHAHAIKKFRCFRWIIFTYRCGCGAEIRE